MIDGLTPYQDYKESGVPWLGQIPKHWEVRRMRNVAEMRVSNVDKLSKDGERSVRLCNYVDVYKHPTITGSINFMRATATAEEIERFRLNYGDVLITKDSEDWNDIGVPALVDYVADDLICGYHLALLRPHPNLLGDYLSRALQSTPVAYQFHVEANGVTRYGLSHAAIKSICLPLPPIPEQEVIVRFLDRADRLIRRYIRSKKNLIALLNEQKQAIINHTVTRGLNSRMLSPVQSDDFRQGSESEPSPNHICTTQTGIPWLTSTPNHWGISASKRLFAVRKELALPGDIQLSATQAYGVIPQAEFEQKVGRKVVRISMHLEKRRHVEKDDFVISMRSFQGGLERAWASGCIRSSYVVLKPNTEVHIPFFAYLFKSHGYIQALRATANFIRDGQDLNFSNFCLVDLPLVPLEEQQAIADYLDRSTAHTNIAIDRARGESALLHEFLTRLIADIVTGKLDVRDAAARLPEEAVEPETIDEAENVDEFDEDIQGEEMEDAIAEADL